MTPQLPRFIAPLLVALAASFGGPLRTAQEWPEWRGPGGQGHAEATGLPRTWSETEHIAWRCPLPGRGYSSPVIGGGRVWLTTAVEKRLSPEETAARNSTRPADLLKSYFEGVSFRVLCVEQKTGALLHDIPIFEVAAPAAIHDQNSYATPTPVLAGGRVYCHFGSYGTACLAAADGRVLWRNTDVQVDHELGPVSSPVLWRDRLVFHADGMDRQLICALDAATGKLAWQTARSGPMHENGQFKKSYGTPIVIESGGRPVLVSTAADWVYGYAPQTGEELWRLSYGKGGGFSISARPVAGLGMFFLSTCFKRAEVIAVRHEGVAQPEIVWQDSRNAPNICSPLLRGEELYLVSSAGVLACVNARTGEPWYRERLAGPVSAAPLLADGRIYFCGKNGVTTVVEPGREFRVLASNPLDGTIHASPAAVDGALYLRTDQALYRIQN